MYKGFHLERRSWERVAKKTILRIGIGYAEQTRHIMFPLLAAELELGTIWPS